MAIAVTGGHVSRAIDFYDRASKYFIIGGSTPWENEPDPEMPNSEDFKLRDVIGLKKVDDTFLVIPDNENGTISYREQKWRVVNKEFSTTVEGEGVPSDSYVVPLSDVAGLNIGSKLRIANTYEGIITNITGTNVTLDTKAPVTIDAGLEVLGGAIVEDAKYVYVGGYLEYDNFPLATYRQIGLCTGVVPKTGVDTNILKASAFNNDAGDQFDSLGVLEILDNRSPIPRDINMRELISMIVEF